MVIFNLWTAWFLISISRSEILLPSNDLSIELSGNYYKHDWYRFMTEIPYTQPEQNDRKQYEAYSVKLKEKNHFTRINGHYNFSYTFDKYIKYHVIDGDYS